MTWSNSIKKNKMDIVFLANEMTNEMINANLNFIINPNSTSPNLIWSGNRIIYYEIGIAIGCSV